MLFTDTIRLTFTNSGLMWRMMLYMLLGIVLICGIAVACCYPLIMELVDSGFFDQIVNAVSAGFLNFDSGHILSDTASIMTQFWDILSANSAELIPFVVGLFVIIGIGGSFYLGLMQIPCIECIYGNMSSYSRLAFGGCFIKNFGRSVKFALARLLVVLPMDIIILVAFFASLELFALSDIVSALAPFIIVLILIALFSIRICVTSTWASSIVAKNNGIWAGLKDSMSGMAKTFRSMFSTAIILTLLMLVVNVIVFVLTAGVGLLITIPCSVLLYYVYGNTAFFYANGLKFYLDKNTIVTPRKLEDFDKLADLKNIV